MSYSSKTPNVTWVRDARPGNVALQSEHLPPCVQVYVNQPTDANCRNVTAKYLHPEFNQHSLVANLALLRLKKPFNEYSHVVMPLILDNNMLELPTNLSFKGFGMINLAGQNVLNDKTKLSDNVMVRTLNVNYSGEMCFNSVKGSVRADL